MSALPTRHHLQINANLHCTYTDTRLHDCIYEYIHAVHVNGFACKDAKDVAAEDFHFSGLHKAGNTSSSKQGSAVTAVNVAQIPGLNTMGISMVRIDYAPSGMNPPHTHPRATEILTVLEGSLFVGFVTSNPVADVGCGIRGG
jgi:hypothetical protein